MNDKIKQVVPDLNFNNKSRLVMLTVGKFDQGFVVRNVLAKKTVGLATMGDIYGMAAQVADELYNAIVGLLQENKAINIQIQLLDGQIGIIPLGFEQINDMNMLQKLFASLNPLINRSGFKAPHSNSGYKDFFSDAKDNDSNQQLAFDPSVMFANNPFSGFNAFNSPGFESPFFIAEEDVNDPRVLAGTDKQGKPIKRYYSGEEKANAVKVTEDGHKIRLEGN